jgi:DNA modification methylase
MKDWTNRCHFGDCLETLRQMPDRLVQTCVTSPPYFGLRDYGHAGQIGLEPTPDEFVAKLVTVFREVRRVLRDDGTLWVNIGDSYCSTAPGTRNAPQTKGSVATPEAWANARPKTPDGMKPKDLMGIPWMLAFALRADGWYLRQEIIWHKPNPMPESVTDRCTKSHEQIFLLAKSASYYCDMGAIKEPAVADHAPGNHSHKGTTAYEQEEGEHHRTKAGLVAYAQRQRSKRNSFARTAKDSAGEHGQKPQFREDREPVAYEDTRNKRSVWTVSTKPYKGAHFATFPTDLIEPCVLAGAPAGGVVLDPFFGSGTTGQVAQALGRQFVGIELNPAYKALQDERLRQPSLMLEAA